MKKLFYLLIFLFFINIVSATTYDYYINKSTLPFYALKEVALLGEENLTINLTYHQFLDGAKEINFNTTTAALTFNISINNSIAVGNYSSEINLLASNENYTYTIFFNFFILDDFPYPDVEFIMIDINEFEYVLCDYMIPYNTTKTIIVNALYEEIVYTEYDSEFFTLLNNFTMPEQNYTEISTSIHLRNLVVGDYTKIVKFFINDNYSDVIFHFTVDDCTIPITACYDLFIEKEDMCGTLNKTVYEILECKRLTILHEQCIYEALIDAAESKIIYNETIRYVINHTLLPILNIDDPLIEEALRTLPVNMKILQSNDKARQSKMDEIINKIEDWITNYEEKYDIKLKNVVSELALQNQILQDKNIKYTGKYTKNSTIWWWIILIIIIVGSILLYFRYRENYITG